MLRARARSRTRGLSHKRRRRTNEEGHVRGGTALRARDPGRRRCACTWPTTTRAPTTRSTAAAATRSPPRRSPGRPGSPCRGSTTPRASTRCGARSAARSRPSTSGSPAAPSATAKAALALPEDRVPQLDEVTAGLRPLTGFSYHPAAGLVPLDEFYGSLADRVFHSTQYIRHPSAPLYTPEPDLVHEVIGHGNLLADPTIAEVKRLAGEAARALRDARGPAVRGRRVLVHARVRRPVGGGRAALLRRRAAVVVRRDRGVPRGGHPAARLRAPWARSSTTSPTTSRCSSPATAWASSRRRRRVLRGVRRRRARAADARRRRRAGVAAAEPVVATTPPEGLDS